MESYKLTYIHQGEGIKIVSPRKVQCMPGRLMYKFDSVLVLLTLVFLDIRMVTPQRTVILLVLIVA